MHNCFRGAAVFGLAALTLGSVGCSTVAKQAWYEVRGAKAELILNHPVGERALADYQGVRFMPATTDLSQRLLERDALQRYDRTVAKKQEELQDVYPGGQPELVISTDVLHAKKKDLLGAAQVLARVKMRDGERVVVDAILNVQSHSFREDKPGELAEVGAREIAKFLRKQKGEGGEDDEDEKGAD